jgi:aminotransferase
MKELSKRVKQAPKSQIRELFNLAAGRKDVISLGIGQPDFKTPEPIIKANTKALEDGITMYAPTRGKPELLELIAKKFREVNNINLGNDNVILTNGGSQAITFAYATVFNPGDELILCSPNFISYFYCGLFFGIKVIESKRMDNFSPNIEDIKNKINKKTKAILINSPNNPTGYVLTKKEIEEIADIVIENDLYLISDEVYENYLYDNAVHISPASLDGMLERTITLNAMSKLFSATGFRLGYVGAPAEIIDLMEKYLQYTVAGTNHAAQFGFIEALKMDKKFFVPILKDYNSRRLFCYKRLKEMGFDVIKPKGAFYIMPGISNFNINSDEFSRKIMKEKAVAIVPGSIFGSYSADKLRLSYATSIENLEIALKRIEDFLKYF